MVHGIKIAVSGHGHIQCKDFCSGFLGNNSGGGNANAETPEGEAETPDTPETETPQSGATEAPEGAGGMSIEIEPGGKKVKFSLTIDLTGRENPYHAPEETTEEEAQ